MASESEILRSSSRTSRELARARSKYVYRTQEQNLLSPVCEAESWPWLREQYGPSWILPFIPGFLKSEVQYLVTLLRSRLQKILFRFDKLEAYGEIFSNGFPKQVQDFEKSDDAAHDAAFAWWRIAGANGLVLRREDHLGALCQRIPLPVDRIESRLLRLGISVTLEEAARDGKLFAVDYGLLLKAIQRNDPDARRDSRWRDKYLPSPIGVFLADSTSPSGLIPLAIQIDQRQSERDAATDSNRDVTTSYNPVYTPEDGWGWRIAKAYFETADTTYQSGVGHLLGAHLAMEPFCMATPRQLPSAHCVYMLLRPHMRFTLTANQAAFKYLVDRKELYGQVYSASLDQFREVIIQGYFDFTFLDREFETDLERRGVSQTPFEYPFRDDLRLWIRPIHDFVRAYIEAFYEDDAEVQSDEFLQAWKDELTDPDCGAVRGLVPDDRLDTRDKLIDLLAQIIFTAGPGHAAQHYSVDHLYRYSPQFPGSIHAPPPGAGETLDFATWIAMLPPIDETAVQFRSSVFTEFRYDRFGDYRRYPLGRHPKAQAPIAALHRALEEVDRTIESRQAGRLYPYDFVRPSRVPNSTNI